MKKIIFTVFFLICSFSLFSQQMNREIGKTYTKENIAVFEIEDSSSGYSQGLGKQLTALIEDSLTKMNRFNIVDRKNLDKYLKEMELQLTGITESQVIEVGKIYGYSKAIKGNIVSADVSYNYDSDTGSGSIYGQVEMVLQIVDVETTKIMYSSKLQGISYYSTTSYPSYSLRKTAINDACNDLAAKVEDKMREIFKITLTISDIIGKDVIILAGRNQGIDSKTRFKVYSKKDNITLPSGNVINGGYDYKGTLRVKELGSDYSVLKISRGRNIQAGDIARETIIGDFIAGISLNYASYNINAFNTTYESTVRSSNGKLKISLNENKYALGLHLKIGYNGIRFSPNISLGLLFGDFFKSSYAVDARFNFDININLYQEVLRLVITPYVGMGISFTTIGEVYGGNYFIDNYTYLRNGAKIDSRDIMFGIGAIASIQYNITDTIGVNLGVGYRFYTNPINLGVFSDKTEVTLPEKIKTVNLTGLEFTLGAYLLL